MGRHYKRKKGKLTVLWILLAVIIIAVVATGVYFVYPHIMDKINSGEQLPESFEEDVSEDENGAIDAIDEESGQDEITEEAITDESEAAEEGTSEASAATDEPEITTAAYSVETVFPVTFENGMIVIESLFQYDGENPDCEDQEGSNVAAIALRNTSGEYLERAQICLTSYSAETLRFEVCDLPAGKSVIALSQDNVSTKAGETCGDAVCTAVFGEASTPIMDNVNADVDGASITLQNNSGEEFNNIDVYCHSVLGDQYFGGITYIYTIDNLPAYGTVQFEAEDCFLGFAEVVRIVANES